MFPELEISGGGTFAFIVTLSNRIKIYSISPIHGRMFVIPDLGVFQLDEKYRYTFKKSEVYFFNQLNCNPIDIQSFSEIRKLELQHPELYIKKVQRVEAKKKKMHEIYLQLKKEGASETDLIASVYDGTLEKAAERLVDMEMKMYSEVPKTHISGLSERAEQWLNDYYREDVVIRYNIFGRILAEPRFKLRASLPVLGFLPMNRTMGKQNLGLIIVNNRVIELDPTIKVELHPETGISHIKTKQHGDFKVMETDTRYRYGKQNIYLMAVSTKGRMPKMEIVNN